MHAFPEYDGALKAGAILADNGSSLQIESATGKRLKVKADRVLLRFAAPGPQMLLDAAEQLAECPTSVPAASDQKKTG